MNLFNFSDPTKKPRKSSEPTLEDKKRDFLARLQEAQRRGDIPAQEKLIQEAQALHAQAKRENAEREQAQARFDQDFKKSSPPTVAMRGDTQPVLTASISPLVILITIGVCGALALNRPTNR